MLTGIKEEDQKKILEISYVSEENSEFKNIILKNEHENDMKIEKNIFFPDISSNSTPFASVLSVIFKYDRIIPKKPIYSILVSLTGDSFFISSSVFPFFFNYLSLKTPHSFFYTYSSNLCLPQIILDSNFNGCYPSSFYLSPIPSSYSNLQTLYYPKNLPEFNSSHSSLFLSTTPYVMINFTVPPFTTNDNLNRENEFVEKILDSTLELKLKSICEYSSNNCPDSLLHPPLLSSSLSSSSSNISLNFYVISLSNTASLEFYFSGILLKIINSLHFIENIHSFQKNNPMKELECEDNTNENLSCVTVNCICKSLNVDDFFKIKLPESLINICLVCDREENDDFGYLLYFLFYFFF
jgi:hypothetical protein